ncbi:rhamnose binding lectin-like precursor isoform X1, partial [Silurus meridionalis]
VISLVTVITCDGKVQRLACASGVIQVASTIYGRTNRHTCTFNRQPFGCARTNCAMGTSVIADRCNGRRNCEVKTDLLGSPDPCYGIYKYYQTTYNCITGREVVICEQGYRTLSCGDNMIQIINANYGRSDSKTCSNGLPAHLTQNTNCYAPRTYSIVASKCNGKNKCTLEASKAIFTDPCYGTSKYLTVSYKCTPTIWEIVTCEGNTAVLTCGDRHLKIISANYGRTDSTTCSTGLPIQISNTNCYTTDTLYKVAARCDGKTSCDVPATNGFFSDPCVGTYKYLKMVYSCV